AFVVIVSHVGNSDPADIFREPRWLIGSPAWRRLWQNGKQFRIIDHIRHKHRLVLGIHRADCKADEQCQHKESLWMNESHWFHASTFLRLQLPYSIDFAAAVCQYAVAWRH